VGFHLFGNERNNPAKSTLVLDNRQYPRGSKDIRQYRPQKYLLQFYTAD
jgi:hypothetical protein